MGSGHTCSGTFPDTAVPAHLPDTENSGLLTHSTLWWPAVVWCWPHWELWAESGTSVPLLLFSASWPQSLHMPQERAFKIQDWPNSRTCQGSLSGHLPSPATPNASSTPWTFLCKGCSHSWECLPCILHLTYFYPLHEGLALPGQCCSVGWHVIAYTKSHRFSSG